MARTNEDLVKAIIDVDDGDDLSPFLDAANSMVTEVCALPVYAYPVARLRLIETWLAAHFYCVYRPRAKVEDAGMVRVHYQSQVEIGFNVTHYGQMAMRLDTAGGLAAINNTIKVIVKRLPVGTKISGFWLGTPKPPDGSYPCSS